MLGILAIVFASIWLLGMVTSTTLGGFIHVLVVVAAVLLFLRFIQEPHNKKVHSRARH